MEQIKGYVQLFGDDVDTDQILPGYAMSVPVEELAQYAMAGSEKNFKENIAERKIIVAGKNFGSGSSREQAPIALKSAGVHLVIAKSFARIFRRNAINIGLPVFQADIVDKLVDGDFLEVDVEKGTIIHEGKTIEFSPLSENVRRTLSHGGLINRVRADLGID